MRRSLFIFIIAALIAFGVYRWFELGNRLHGHSHSEPFTPAAGPRVDPKDLQVLAALDAEYTRLVQAVVPSVVTITTTRNAPNINPSLALLLQRMGRGNLTQPTHSLGSGVIVSGEGHILTNHHVIANMDEILVQLTDGRTVPAAMSRRPRSSRSPRRSERLSRSGAPCCSERAATLKCGAGPRGLPWPST